MNTPEYTPRIIDPTLDEFCAALPAIAIEGAKGVGKTVTTSRRAATVIDLDDADRLQIVAADPRAALRAPAPILIDEWQRLPTVWDRVRRAVDDGAPPGQFLLTGSSSPANLGTHSGAGRIVSVRMRPMSLAERIASAPTVSLTGLLTGTAPRIEGHSALDLEGYVTEILRSGFPGLRGFSGAVLRAHLDGYIARIIDRDFPELGHEVRNPAALRRWLNAYAAAVSTSASFETIRDASTSGQNDKPAKTTVLRYTDALERLWLVDSVPGWVPTRNHIAGLTVAPKRHLADPALNAQLLDVDSETLLSGRATESKVPRDGTLLGALFESLVTLSVRVYADAAEAKVGYLRTKGGAREVDLIVSRGDRVVALEVKLGATVDDSDVRHLHWLKKRIGAGLMDAVVVTTGPEAYRRSDGIAVVPAALLGP